MLQSLRNSARLKGRWNGASAAMGGLIWLGILALPAHGEVGVGVIEWLFLFAPLVLVPLAMGLIGNGSHRVLFRTAEFVQPFAAVLIAVSFLLPQGFAAAACVFPWSAMTFVVGLCGVIGFTKDPFVNAPKLCFHEVEKTARASSSDP